MAVRGHRSSTPAQSSADTLRARRVTPRSPRTPRRVSCGRRTWSTGRSILVLKEYDADIDHSAKSDYQGAPEHQAQSFIITGRTWPVGCIDCCGCPNCEYSE